MRPSTGVCAFLLSAACMLAALSTLEAGAAAQNAKWGANYFPNVTLTTHEGTRVRFYDDLIKGKIVAINLIYTSCKYACTLETARLAQVQKLVGDRMGRDVFFYSITIDPEFDTPEVLKAYAEKFNAGPGWLFLTGTRADIEAISRKTGLYSKPDQSNPDGHTPHLLVGNEVTGQWMRNSAVDNPKFLAGTITTWLNSWRTADRQVKSYTEVPKITMDAGEYMFRMKCAACHDIGGGDRLGPDLLNVTARRDRAWLIRMITSPEALIEEGDPAAVALRARFKQVRMPRLGLGDAEAAALLDYIARQSAGSRTSAATAPMPSTPAAPPGSPPAAGLPPIVDAYLHLHQAVHAGATGDLAGPAGRISAAALKLGTAGRGIRTAARAFQQPLSLESARTSLSRLGDAIIVYAGARRTGLGEGVKVAYCPMLRKYWLQRGDTIQNPFDGPEMSACGRFVASLPSLSK